MRFNATWVFAITTPICAAACATHALDREAGVTFVAEVPRGYRDWKLVSVAREEAPLDDIRAVLANDLAIETFREGKRDFPDGAVIARLAWAYQPSEENNQAFGRMQSYVPGAAKNGVQFMIKDSEKYAATGGWGYGHFVEGKLAERKLLDTCFPCHQAIAERDFVFTQYAR